MAESSKQTIYIDVDDEITTIIDKVKDSPKNIVALVLPKRAAVLQSVVNMKLLKKSAAKAKKSLVLITTDQNLLPLAGVVGLHVAKSLQSKPEIPPLPAREDSSAEEEPVDPDTIDKAASIGSLAATASATPSEDETETIELDETAGEPVEKTSKLKKRLKVPNFDKFRLRFFLIILGVILLVFGWFMAFVVMPKATVTIHTDTSTVTSSLSFMANTQATAVDIENRVLPAVSKEVKKTDTEKVPATGKLDKGTKATGSITIRNCDYSDGFVIPAGSVFSSGGKNFVSNESVSVPKFSGPSSSCTLAGNNSGKGTVNVTAQGGGESYNIKAAQYSVPGIPSSAKVDAVGTDMTGGTTNVVAVVSQSDVDNAAAKMKGRLDNEAINDLGALFSAEDLRRLEETRTSGTPAIKASPAVNEEASEVTVTSETAYSELAIRNEDLDALIRKDVETKVDMKQQSILDNGLKAAVLRQENRKSPTEAQIGLQTLVLIGPELNENSIKDQIKGKKRGEAETVISGLPGVKEVDIEYKPFWVYSTPKAAKKIKIVIEKPALTETAAPEDSPEETNEAP